MMPRRLFDACIRPRLLFFLHRAEPIKQHHFPVFRPSRVKPLPDGPDPFELVAGDLSGMSDGIKSLIGTDHPVLNAAAKYFFELDGGKKIRPTMVSKGVKKSLIGQVSTDTRRLHDIVFFQF